MAIRIQLRKDHPDVWDNADPTLAAGEFGFAWDSADSASFGRLKIGDGSTSWTNLPYFYSAGDSAGNYASSGASGLAWNGDRAMSASGYTTDWTNTNIDYFSITTGTDAAEFGDMVLGCVYGAGCSDTSRGITFGGSYGTQINDIQYVAISTPGNASDFGDMNNEKAIYGSAVSDGTYGLNLGGYLMFSGTYTPSVNVDYITIQTTSNATDFGDMPIAIYRTGALNDATRGVNFGGSTTANVYNNNISYITMSTPGNGSDFGDLSGTRYFSGGASDATRGVIVGGQDNNGTRINIIEYITIQTTGNATDFGDLATGRVENGTVSNGSELATFGGFTSGGRTDNIEKLTIQTLGNASSVGTLTAAVNSSVEFSGNA